MASRRTSGAGEGGGGRQGKPANGRTGFGMGLYVPSTLRTAHLVIFGGEGPVNFSTSGTGELLNDVWDFDLRARVWSRWPALNTSNGWDVPSARANMSIAIDRDVMVVSGGYARNLLEDTHAYMFGTGHAGMEFAPQTSAARHS